MDGEWLHENGNVHDELDLTILDSFYNNMPIIDCDVEYTTDEDYTGASSSRKKRSERASKSSKRHSPYQIQQLEAVFLECPHPDDKVRLKLAKKLGMDALQVKFWFQNRRSAKKNQLEKEENKMLREENEALKVEQQAIKEAVLKKTCPKCGGPMVPHDENPENMHLLLDNVRLKEELRHVNSVLKEATGKAPMPMPIPMPYSYSQLVADLDINGTDSALVMDPVVSPPPNHALRVQGCVHGSCASKRSALLGRVLRARDEFIMLVKDDTMWLPTLDGEMLEYPRYHKVTFPGILGFCPFGFGAYGTRDAGIVMGTGPELVSILTDPARLCEAFPGVVASAASNSVVPASVDHEQVQLMDVNLMVLSPRMPICNALFARHAELIETNTWAVVDISVTGIFEQGGTSGANTWINAGKAAACRMEPSGCLIEDMNNGCCKVTWVAHLEIDRTQVPEVYHSLLRSGHALGARRWLTSLQRWCQHLNVLRSGPSRYVCKAPSVIPPLGRNGVLKLAQQMTSGFCATICGAGPRGQSWSRVQEWRGSSGVGADSFEVAVRVATLHTAGYGQGAQAGLVVSAATVVWLPGIPAKHVFDYICDGDRRAEWDTFFTGKSVQQEDYAIALKTPRVYAVSVLRPKTADGTIHKKLILQQACGDASCMLLAYAQADEQPLKEVMRGGSVDHAAVSLLPSGFVVLPDGRGDAHIPPADAKRPSGSAMSRRNNEGSLVSVLVQRFLSGSPPPEHLAKHIISNAGSLVFRSIVKIKEAVHANIVVTN